MKKLCALVLVAVVWSGAAWGAEKHNYKAYWGNLSLAEKEVLTTAYLLGYYHGSCSFGFIYKKVFNKTLSLEQLNSVNSALPIQPGNVLTERTAIIGFMNLAYKDDSYQNVNIYDAMETGISCSSRMSPDECLSLFGEMLKARTQ